MRLYFNSNKLRGEGIFYKQGNPSRSKRRVYSCIYDKEGIQ